MTIKVLFDGGYQPGRAYGSFKIQDEPIERLEYPHLETSNQAEFATAIAALKRLAVKQKGIGPIDVELWGDSQLAVHCLSGKWRTKAEGLKPLLQEFKSLIGHFGSVKLFWHRRHNSVAVLGH